MREMRFQDIAKPPERPPHRALTTVRSRLCNQGGHSRDREGGFPDVEALANDRGGLAIRRRRDDSKERSGDLFRGRGDRRRNAPPTRSDGKWTYREEHNVLVVALCEGFVSVSLADDMAVPISKIPEAVSPFKEAEIVRGDRRDLWPCGDGNLHTKMLLDPTLGGLLAEGEKGGRRLRYGIGPRRNGNW